MEYQALIECLSYIQLHLPNSSFSGSGDSLLIINHLNQQWEVKSPSLLPLQKKASIIDNLTIFSIKHLKRKFNIIPDAIANWVMDNHSSTQGTKVVAMCL